MLADWSRPEDYTGQEDAEWLDCTVMRSDYQQQVNLMGPNFRHRKISNLGAWVEGPAPISEKSK